MMKKLLASLSAAAGRIIPPAPLPSATLAHGFTSSSSPCAEELGVPSRSIHLNIIISFRGLGFFFRASFVSSPLFSFPFAPSLSLISRFSTT